MASQLSGTRTLPSILTRHFYFGWVIAVVGFVAQFVFTAAGLSIIGNLVTPLSTEFGVSKAWIGIGPGICILVMGILGPFIGRLIDAGHVRRVMVVGGLMSGFGLVGIACAQSFWQVAAAFVLLCSPGLALYGTLPTMALIANWFVRRRGLALGGVVAGATIASAIGPNYFETLAADYGWRAALASFGALTAAVAIPLFGGLVVARPEEMGLRPDGVAAAGVAEGAAAVVLPRPAGELARDPMLWLQATGFGLVLTSPVVIISVLVPYGEALGMTRGEAADFYIWMLPFSLLGKLVIGGLADVTPLKPSIAMIVLTNALVWYLLRQEPDYATLMTIGAIYGIGIGGAAPLHGVLLGRLFGRADFGTASGLGGIVGVSLIVAASFASQGLLAATDYDYPLLCAVQMALLLAGGALLAFLRIPSPEDTR